MRRGLSIWGCLSGLRLRVETFYNGLRGHYVACGNYGIIQGNRQKFNIIDSDRRKSSRWAITTVRNQEKKRAKNTEHKPTGYPDQRKQKARPRRAGKPSRHSAPESDRKRRKQMPTRANTRAIIAKRQDEKRERKKKQSREHDRNENV